MSYLCLSQSGFSVKKPKLKIYISVVHVLHCISIASCLTDILWKEILVGFFLVGGGGVGGCVCLDVLFEFFWGEGVCFLCCFGFFLLFLFCFLVCFSLCLLLWGGSTRGEGLSLPELSRKVVRGIHVTVFKENYYISWSLKSWHCILVVLSVG